MSIKKDKYFINLANNLAKNSLGYTGSNPSVGAVVVKNNEVISFGSTGTSGRPHAEAYALNKLKIKDKKNSTIYVSLEPCAHYGKSPPCVNQIISSKIKRVVFSLKDIDARTSGKSYKILRSKEIKVNDNLLKKKAKEIYKNYFYSKKHKKPYVYGKLAISKDFFLKDKNNFYITKNLSLKTTHILRSRVNCIITTFKTVNDDDPKLNCRIPGLEQFSPVVAIIDKNLKIKNNSFLIKNAKKNKTFIFFNSKKKKKIKFLKSKNIELIYTPINKNNLDFNYILRELYRHEISSVLVEGGRSITNSLLNMKLFNEFYLFQSSQKLKKRGISKMKNIKYNLLNQFKNIKLNEAFVDKDKLIHYF